MGVETLAIAGFSALQAVNTMNQGDAQAKAIAQQGTNEVNNEANTTVRSAGTVRNSYLSGGLTLDGGPAAALAQVFNTGNTNIARTAASANAQSSNAINSARTTALTALAKNASLASLGSSAGSTFDSIGDSAGSMFPETGQDVGSWFESNSIGPYKPFGM